MDTPELSIRELDALFEQSPVAMIFTDNEMRARRANTAFRQLMGFPEGELIGRAPTKQPGISQILDTEFVERTLTEQVIKKGVPVINQPLELTIDGQSQVAAWTAYRVTENGRVFGVMSTLVDITGQAEADEDVRRANTRLDLLQRAASEIGTTLDIHHTAEELAALVIPELVDRVTVDLLDQLLREEDTSNNTTELRFRRVGVGDRATIPTVTVAVDDLLILRVKQPAARIFLRGDTIVARNPDELRDLELPPGILNPLLERGVHAWLAVPLTARGVTLGAATFCRAENPEPFSDADVRLLRDLAARAAVQIDNARLYTREHDAAVTLQRSLLPREIPPVEGLDIAYRYQPASRGAEIGGDWFDVIPLDDGQVTLMVGDVTGHGVHAAATMGQLRTTATALVRLGCPPADILRQLSGVVSAQGDEAGATAVAAVYDPRSQRCRLTSAGHPSPVLRTPDGHTELIDLPAGLLLGTDPSFTYQATGRQLAPGSILALYTDGLIERPGEDIGIGLSRLARALAYGPADSLDALCDAILASLAPHPRDDVALLLARTTP
ncbi:MAG TPA: SpoIIE family protein phosphatase [Trebonia sp.]|nr:SpoIIE family protein phosphatase [Trebonia sp.]